MCRCNEAGSYAVAPSCEAKFNNTTKCWQEYMNSNLSKHNPKYEQTIKMLHGRLTIVENPFNQSKYTFDDLTGFANRENNKRSFLFASKVLGKYIPTSPTIIRGVVHELVGKTYQHLSNKSGNILFVGFAETATNLSNSFFEEYLKYGYDNNIIHDNQEFLFIHTTRYELKHEKLIEFREEHSHAPQHIVYWHEHMPTLNPETLMLIDDEFTTGNTCLNFIEQLLDTVVGNNIKTIHLICLTNWMSEENMQQFHRNQKLLDLGIQVNFIYLFSGDCYFDVNAIIPKFDTHKFVGNHKTKDDVIQTQHINPRLGIYYKNIDSIKKHVYLDYKNDLDDVFRKYQFHQLKDKIIQKISNRSQCKKILVLGSNEFMYIPFLFAEFLHNHLTNNELRTEILYQSTGHSPLLIGNDIKEKVCFKDNYDDGMNNYLYNCKPENYDEIILFSETHPSQNKHFEILNHWNNLTIINLNSH